jgi:hypothetical protein
VMVRFMRAKDNRNETHEDKGCAQVAFRDDCQCSQREELFRVIGHEAQFRNRLWSIPS